MLYSKGNTTQYSVVAYMGKGFKEQKSGSMYVYN